MKSLDDVEDLMREGRYAEAAALHHELTQHATGPDLIDMHHYGERLWMTWAWATGLGMDEMAQQVAEAQARKTPTSRIGSRTSSTASGGSA